MILAAGPVVAWSEICRVTAERLTALGWASGSQREPVSRLTARGVLAPSIGLAENFGWLTRAMREDTVTVHETGRAATWRYLHLLATAPWNGPL
jgi:hypothetical protein